MIDQKEIDLFNILLLTKLSDDVTIIYKNFYTFNDCLCYIKITLLSDANNFPIITEIVPNISITLKNPLFKNKVYFTNFYYNSVYKKTFVEWCKGDSLIFLDKRIIGPVNNNNLIIFKEWYIRVYLLLNTQKVQECKQKLYDKRVDIENQIFLRVSIIKNKILYQLQTILKDDQEWTQRVNNYLKQMNDSNFFDIKKAMGSLLVAYLELQEKNDNEIDSSDDDDDDNNDEHVNDDEFTILTNLYENLQLFYETTYVEYTQQIKEVDNKLLFIEQECLGEQTIKTNVLTLIREHYVTYISHMYKISIVPDFIVKVIRNVNFS